MKTPPVKLQIISGWFAFDGGSITLFGTAQGPEVLQIHLDWSIDSRHFGRPQLTIDDEPVPRGSNAEADWLILIRYATYTATSYAPPHWKSANWPFSPDFEAPSLELPAVSQQDANDGLRRLADQLVGHVLSEAYQNPVAWMPPPTTEEVIRDLLTQGRRADAIFAYRRAHPEANIKEAKLAVASLALEFGIEEKPAPEA